MKNIFYKILLVPAIIFLISSCEKVEYYPSYGDVIGNIKPAGTRITLSRKDKSFVAYSDANGYFSIQNLESGIYNITFDKPSHFTYKTYGFNFIGGPELEFICTPGKLDSIMVSPETVITLKSISGSNDDPYHLYISWTSSIKASLGIRIFINDKSGVSLPNYKQTALRNRITGYGDEFIIDKTLFSNTDRVYIIAYAVTCDTWRTYYDWDRKILIYPVGNKPSNELEYK